MSDLPKRVVDKMMEQDPFSAWMGMELIEIGKGHCTLQMTVRKEMLNGFAKAHGAITYALADSCLAFAANSYGEQALSIETSISHTRGVMENDRLEARATQIDRGGRLARYRVEVKRLGDGLVVASFHGTVYNSGKSWFE